MKKEELCTNAYRRIRFPITLVSTAILASQLEQNNRAFRNVKLIVEYRSCYKVPENTESISWHFL